ncbi:ABC transporter ATP-binding protein [Knoellia sp. S7-12]|uniref:ABC transporter ATP-binding protein n=1 Tax=Knoellia sp. S7-12 TaxID=3126698 RepID=UPI003369766C
MIRSLTQGHRRLISVLGVVSFVGALTEAAFLVLITTSLVGLANGRNETGPVLGGMTLTIPSALGLGAAAVTVRLLLSVASVRMSSALTTEVGVALRHRLARSYFRASWPMHQSEPAGRLQELLTSFVSRVSMAVVAITQGLIALLSLLALLGTGFIVQPLATVAMLVALSLFAFVLIPLRRRIRARARFWARSNVEFASSVSELSSLGQELHTFGVQGEVNKRVEALTVSNAEEQRAVQTLNGLLTPLYTSLAYIAIMAGLAGLSAIGVGDVAAVGAVMLLLLRSLTYGQQLLAVAGQLASSVPFVEGLEEATVRYETHQALGGKLTPHAAAPLELDSVTFAYTDDREPALKDVSLTIGRGETVGVIGPSGSGKSTLAQLILGLRKPLTGAVRAGGADLLEVDREWWAQHVSYVPQDPILITGSVAENIRFFRDGIGDAALADAARRANILADIEALPRGFETHLGERGNRLSGGQRQRLSIARALVGQPDLLVLDEPTSALDGQSEMLIRDTLADLHGSVSMVIIAHRMSTLNLCDRIVVIERGRVTADEHPEVLRMRSDFYRRALAVAGMS